MDHIIPSPLPADKIVKEKTTTEIVEWQHLDDGVLQWIYGKNSHDLLGTIIVPDTTAMKAWESLRLLFQDTEISSGVYLEQQFNTVKLNNIPNMDSYCLELKTLANQLVVVGAPMSNNRLVLGLIAGLNDNYDGIKISLSREKPLPSFTEAHYGLIMEGKCKAHQDENDASLDAKDLLTSTLHDALAVSHTLTTVLINPEEATTMVVVATMAVKRVVVASIGAETMAATPRGHRPTEVKQCNNSGAPDSGSRT